jgi:predicted RNA binding protein YcfA (HicA-like mRNA interferase family)
MKARDAEKAIVANGWYRIKSEGHRQYKHPTKSGRVTIPWHKNGSEDLSLNTVASIEKQAGIKLR